MKLHGGFSQIIFKCFLIFMSFGLNSVFLVGSDVEERILSPAYQFGGLDIDAKLQLNKPADFIVSRDRIIVSDADDDCLVVFDKKGRLIRRIGRQGQGPGEFNRPGKIDVFKNKIIASDTQNSRFHVFYVSGECLKTYRGAPGLLAIGCVGSTKFGPLMIFLKRWFGYNKTTQGDMHEYLQEIIV